MTPPVWRKSTRSTEGTSEQCVEVADLPGAIGVRDSKTPEGPYLSLRPSAFSALLNRVKRGQL